MKWTQLAYQMFELLLEKQVGFFLYKTWLLNFLFLPFLMVEQVEYFLVYFDILMVLFSAYKFIADVNAHSKL